MPQSLVGAMVEAIRLRKDFVADEVIRRVDDLADVAERVYTRDLFVCD